MKKILLSLTFIISGMVYLTSCYNNKYDVLSLPTISFTKEVVPIFTSGPCGCHNALGRARGNAWVQFTDTLTGKPNYDAILARTDVMGKWASGQVPHPGGGDVWLTPTDKKIISDWIAQGAVSDYEPPTVSGTVTYTANIAPMVKTTCNGGQCHGGAAKALDYASLTTSSNISNLTKMANSNGASGHPGGVIPLSKSATSMLLLWITQGTKQ